MYEDFWCNSKDAHIKDQRLVLSFVSFLSHIILFARLSSFSKWTSLVSDREFQENGNLPSIKKSFTWKWSNTTIHEQRGFVLQPYTFSTLDWARPWATWSLWAGWDHRTPKALSDMWKSSSVYPQMRTEEQTLQTRCCYCLLFWDTL